MQAVNPLYPRIRLQQQITSALRSMPVTALLGPRQSGKTWIARTLQVPPENYFDLEDDVSLIRLEGGAQSVLDRLTGIVIIDEIQRRPHLFTSLRVLADRPQQQARFLLLGSASPALLTEASESLAGRVTFIEMGGFHLGELPTDELELAWEHLWVAGGYPRSYFMPDAQLSHRWRMDYIRAMAERDLRELADSKLSSDQLRRLLLVVAHHQGQAWNHSDIAQTLGCTSKTVKRHMEILKAAYIIRELPPYFANVSKRLRKAPRYYFRDIGLAHALLGLNDLNAIMSHGSLGASWEGFCIEQIIRLFQLDETNCFCYSVQSGTEMDLVVQTPRGLIGFEFKATTTPSKTRSMMESISDLGLLKVFVICLGDRRYALDDTIEVVPLKRLVHFDPFAE